MANERTREVSLVIATDLDNAIGKGQGIPWKMPSDMAHFRKVTTGQAVLMGRKTAESIGMALPNRRNLVLTRSGTTPYPNQTAVASLDEAMALLDQVDPLRSKELCIIGGAEVYKLALEANLVTVILRTEVHTKVHDADTFAPLILEDTCARWNLAYNEWLEPKKGDEHRAKLRIYRP